MYKVILFGSLFLTLQAGAATMICDRAVSNPKEFGYSRDTSSFYFGEGIGAVHAMSETLPNGEYSIVIEKQDLRTARPKVALTIFKNKLVVYSVVNVLKTPALYNSDDAELHVYMSCSIMN